MQEVTITQAIIKVLIKAAIQGHHVIYYMIIALHLSFQDMKAESKSDLMLPLLSFMIQKTKHTISVKKQD